MNATPCSSRSTAPSPRSASESSGRGIDGWCSAVGWNCMNSTSATAAPARSASAMPSPVDTAGLVVTAKSCPAPPVATIVCARPDLHRARRPASSARTPTHRPRLDDQVDGEAALAHLDEVERVHRGDQRPLDLRAGRVAAGVHDARQRVTALAGERERRGRAVAGAVEHRAERHELADPARALGDEHPHRVGVAEPGAGGERVGEVQLGGVRLLERRGDTTLRVAGRRPAPARPS